MPYASRTINQKQLTGNKSFKFQVSSFKFSLGFTLISAVRLATVSQWRSSDIRHKVGFTLIEFLVVLGILAVTVGSTLLFLSSVLRGSNKVSVTTEVKQNGQAVLNSLEKQIRNAVDAQQVDVDTIKLTRQDENPLYIKCFPHGALGPPYTYNGWLGSAVSASGIPGDVYTSFTSKEDTISGVDINCHPSDPPNCDGLKVISSSTGVSSPPIVSICFVASQGIDAPSRQDFQANVTFETTISLRKY